MINIILQKPDWELDWIRELFSLVEHRVIRDGKYEVFRRNSIVVDLPKRHDPLRGYLDGFKAKGLKVGLFHIGSEHVPTAPEYFSDLALVVRMLYRPELSAVRRILFVPLGYKIGFWKGEPNFRPLPASERKYVWSFVGQLRNKPTRLEMITNALKTPHGLVFTTGGWRDPKELVLEEYREIMTESAFVPCPSGWAHPESYRLCEALEAGAIPIVEYADDYFGKMFGTPVPFPAVRSWEEFQTVVEISPKERNALQGKCIAWWKKYKLGMAKRIKTLVDKNLLTG